MAAPSQSLATSPAFIRSARSRRRWRRVITAALAVAALGVIALGVARWAPEHYSWGVQGHVAPCNFHASCDLAWHIDHVNVLLTTDPNSPQAGMDVCQFSPGGQTITAQTTEAQINQARQLSLSSDGCATIAVVETAQNVTETTAVVYFFIALICAVIVVELSLHATRPRRMAHVLGALFALLVAFAWLPAGSYNDSLFTLFEPMLAIAVAPVLLATLLWRLLLGAPPGRGWNIARAATFSLLFVIMGEYCLTRLVSGIWQLPSIYALSFTTGTSLLVGAMLMALAVIVISNTLPQFRSRREYSRILGIGTLVALIPLAIFDLLPLIFASLNFADAAPLINPSLAAIVVIALPLSLVFVVLRRDLLRVDSLIRVTTERGLWLLAVAMLGAIALSFAALIAQRAFGIVISTEATITSYIALLVVALLVPGVQPVAQTVTEAWVFPQMHRYRQVLSDPALDAGGDDPGQIANALAGEIKFALPVRAVALFVGEQQTGRFVPALDSETAPAFASHHPALPALRRAVTVVDRVAIPPATDLPNWEGPDPAAEWTAFVPVQLRDTLVAFIALGRRDDDLDYSTTDRALLMELAKRRALALDYSRIVADLRVAYAQQQELDRLKDQFILTAHHELRTPLTGLVGYIELLRDLGEQGRRDDVDSANYFLDRAFRSANDLASLMSTLLDADPLSVDPTRLRRDPFAIAPLLRRVAEDVTVAYRERDRHVAVRLETDEWALGDEQAVMRILTNLLTNAIKYSPDSSPVVLSARRRQDAELVEFIVRDWGAGIPLGEQALIFERFVRLERDLNSPVRGTGLGLFVARTLVQAMGGTIWVESAGQSGDGCTFHFTLPLARVPETTTAQPAIGRAPGSPGTAIR